ncbi:hypothetical protein [Aquimarina mytili]|uniref:Uncharacterized protein n=1 Tax=Aquimarina mytili TaxID=874423 RepID=A0A936ZYM6_9FLAO|nr:hypothetical protein [Aquimarina mytili]MBL0684741.1 hypothetical protein [Aquimarina mytili]
MDKELAKYIIKYYGGLLNDYERKAYQHILSMSKLGWRRKNKKLLKAYESKGWISTDPKVLELIKNGTEEFFRITAQRILNDHNEQIFINNCSKCKKLTRTPEARQCRHCGNKWFDESKPE